MIENKEEKKKIKQTFLIGFIIGLLLVCLGFGAYLLFAKNGTSSDKCKEEPMVFTSNKIQLDSNNKKYQIGENVYNLKFIAEEEKGALYLNDAKVATIDYANIVTSFVGNYLFIEWPGAQGGSLAYGYFDEEANYYDLSDKYLYDVTYEGITYYCYVEDIKEDYDTKKVELTLDGNNVTTKDIK